MQKKRERFAKICRIRINLNRVCGVEKSGLKKTICLQKMQADFTMKVDQSIPKSFDFFITAKKKQKG